MAFKRSAVRLRLAPPLRSMNINMSYCIIFLSLRHPTLEQHRGSTLNRSPEIDPPVDPSWGGNSLGREQPPPRGSCGANAPDLRTNGGPRRFIRQVVGIAAGAALKIARLMRAASGAANAQSC